jgi:hypothetical protein
MVLLLMQACSSVTSGTLYHIFQGLATGTTFRVNGGRRGEWAERGHTVAHKMWVCNTVTSNGKGSCGLEKVSRQKDVKPEDGNYNIYQNVGITPTFHQTLEVVTNQREWP